ncbi:hypothetical protein EJM73_09065 [Clostridium botulinum]|uniref:hypothetical protein n=1 Tax=Clostridium botulinum TaxID=1491 RepID=UPI001375D90D|nr:hypothetical protein [Clostridium botulinum]NCI19775.1 hypothetical protein [Clostridium botulinum]NCI35813.1 hypothetical protein [Clostridium botulinum]NCI71670.1 hypothetical protein [Clostridium botulinum]NDI38862.1 hypothetical protein [Clostridium botulinum]
MEKIKFIYIDVEEETKEIKQLLDKGLIKYFYGKDSTEPDFIYLTKNEEIIKSSITSGYRISDILRQSIIMFDGSNINIKNLWGDEINLDYKSILDLMKENLNSYLPEDTQELIYQAEIPADKLTNIINQNGKEQLQMQIEDLLKESKKVI